MFWLGVGLAGALGALSRVFIHLQFFKGLPWGTLCVNVIGCALIGFVMASGEKWVGDSYRLYVTLGFLGGFTTFSSFAFDVFKISQQNLSWGVAYFFTTNICCLLFCFFGLWLGQRA